jgi:osmotically-inducible protein OsmY
MTMSTRHTDSDLRTAVADELSWTAGVDATHVGVSVNGGAVTLSGEVNSYPEKRLAERAALRVRGVSAVADEITVRLPGEGINDTDIARDVGEALQRAVDVPPTVSAVVHDHAVTLSGTATWQYQREAAERAVRYLRGVTAVHDEVALRPSVAPADVKRKITSALVRNAQLDANGVEVETAPGGVVTLRGAVRSWAERRQAEHAAWAAPGVVTVVNELRIGA